MEIQSPEDATLILNKLYKACSDDPGLILLWSNVRKQYDEYARLHVENRLGRSKREYAEFKSKFEDAIDLLYEIAVMYTLTK